MAFDATNATATYEADGLRLTIVALAPDLAPYTSGCYRTEVSAETLAEDWLPPEGANLRTGHAEVYEAAIGDDTLCNVPAAVLSGPTNRGTHLRIRNGTFWGIGLTPAGWARIIRQPASSFANRFTDLRTLDHLSRIDALLTSLREDGGDLKRCAERINTCLRDLLGPPLPAEDTIRALHLGLLSEDTTAVAPMAELAGMNLRTFERFCKRHFGFPASALIKKQRFLRSLGKYMLDPTMRWIHALDTHYWDHAHFIRDFRATMNMTPSDYAARPHPIVKAAVAVTKALAGVPHQALHRPGPVDGRESGV